MAGESRPDHDGAAPAPAESTDSILEALLVDDAQLRWDPKTGKPRVTPRRNAELDRPTGSA